MRPILRHALELKEAADLATLDCACEIKFAGDNADAGQIEGYASMFGLLDQGGDIVMPGAFTDSLAKWKAKGANPPMLWQHDPKQPIGVWTDMSEDSKGLKVKGQLILDVPQATTARALIKAGAVKGLSIGYRTQDREIDRQTGARRLKKLDLWEVSPVTFPMLPEAQISGVKGDFNPRTLEQALRDEGLSHAEAKLATSVFRKHAARDGSRTETALRDEADVLMALRKASAALHD